MIRKQIYLPEELERRLTVASKQQQKSEAELVREALEDKLGSASSVTAGTALMKLAELGAAAFRGGLKNLGNRISGISA